jgi:hypothetical protein
MAVNNKPILSILIDDDKRSRFAALAKDNKKSMGWIVNQAIDRMLEAGSIEIFLDSESKPTQKSQQSSIALSIDAIQRLIDSSIETRLKSIDNQPSSIGLPIDGVEELIKNSIDAHTQSIEFLKGKILEVEASTLTQTYKTHDSMEAQKVMSREDLQVVSNKLDRLTTFQALEIKNLKEQIVEINLALVHHFDDIKDLQTATPEQPAPTHSVDLTLKDLMDATGKSRQAIEKLRKDGRLPTIGYVATKEGRNWKYQQVEMLSKSM